VDVGVRPVVAVGVADGAAPRVGAAGAVAVLDGEAVGRLVRVGVGVGRCVGVGRITGPVVAWTVGGAAPCARAAGLGRTST
jgi:hypothetical protein